MLFVLVLLHWVAKQADLTNLTGLIGALVENANTHCLMDCPSLTLFPN